MSKIDNFVIKIDKKLKDKFGGKASKSPLNPFLYDYYDNLRGQELAEAIDNTSYLMEYNTKVIKFLKKKINYEKKFDNDTSNFYKDLLNDKIGELEYQNGTAVEVLKVLNRNSEREKSGYYQKKKIFDFSKFKKKKSGDKNAK